MCKGNNNHGIMQEVFLFSVTAISVLYVLCSMHREIPESLSATYYDLGNHGWMFQVLMLAMGVLLFPVWVSVSECGHEWMAFVACASLLFVAAAPAFRLPLVGAVHYGSAVVCCVCAVLWQIMEGLWDVTLWFGFVGGMLSLAWRDKWCWWLECAVVGSILCNLWRVV